MEQKIKLPQCSCDKEIPHDGHCWYCQAPILYGKTRRVYITKQGHTANCCDRIECQSMAEDIAQVYGIPEQYDTYIARNWGRSSNA